MEVLQGESTALSTVVQTRMEIPNSVLRQGFPAQQKLSHVTWA